MSEDQRSNSPPGGEELPTYAFPESAARVLSKAAAYADWRAQPAGMIPDFEDLDLSRAGAICSSALRQRGNGWLSAQETRGVLEALRLPVAAGGVATSAEEAARLADQVGYPVAVKLASTQLVHKTEIGGVRLGLADAAAVRRAFEEIADHLKRIGKLEAMDGVLVQPMLKGGVEIMIGMTQDPLFGPLIAFGLGGIHVEILADVCFRITPLTDRDAAEMVRSIRGFRLLQGYRGHPPADLAAIEETLLRVSRLVEEIPEIAELDLNPLFALPPGQGCRIVDARIGVAGEPSS
jgi:acyl-CoA synthetase (NDP forming)